jgi:hypothetical protein
MPDDEARWRTVVSAQTGFFRERMVDPRFEPPPHKFSMAMMPDDNNSLVIDEF